MGKAYREFVGFCRDFDILIDFTVKDYLEYMAALKDVPAKGNIKGKSIICWILLRFRM